MCALSYLGLAMLRLPRFRAPNALGLRRAAAFMVLRLSEPPDLRGAISGVSGSTWSDMIRRTLAKRVAFRFTAGARRLLKLKDAALGLRLLRAKELPPGLECASKKVSPSSLSLLESNMLSIFSHFFALGLLRRASAARQVGRAA